jgi:hypothetical protein
MNATMDVSEAAERFLLGETRNSEVLNSLNRDSDENGRYYYLLLNSMRNSDVLFRAPDLLKDVIKKQRWKHWHWIGKQFVAPSLGAYLTAHPPKGIGAKLSAVKRVISDDPEALEMFHQETTASRGGDHTKKDQSNHDNIMIARAEQGTSRAYTLSRLKSERRDLFERVIAGELSANKAAEHAGWRKKPSPLEALRSAWSKASEEERGIFRKEIS